MANVAEVKTYESDGSDGYSEGTWGYTVAVGESAWSDGGFPSREMAQEKADALAERVVEVQS